jgi:hypothetical protein
LLSAVLLTNDVCVILRDAAVAIVDTLADAITGRANVCVVNEVTDNECEADLVGELVAARLAGSDDDTVVRPPLAVTDGSAERLLSVKELACGRSCIELKGAEVLEG